VLVSIGAVDQSPPAPVSDVGRGTGRTGAGAQGHAAKGVVAGLVGGQEQGDHFCARQPSIVRPPWESCRVPPQGSRYQPPSRRRTGPVFRPPWRRRRTRAAPVRLVGLVAELLRALPGAVGERRQRTAQRALADRAAAVVRPAVMLSENVRTTSRVPASCAAAPAIAPGVASNRPPVRSQEPRWTERTRRWAVSR
jgi:hypothetical protein